MNHKTKLQIALSAVMLCAAFTSVASSGTTVAAAPAQESAAAAKSAALEIKQVKRYNSQRLYGMYKSDKLHGYLYFSAHGPSGESQIGENVEQAVQRSTGIVFEGTLTDQLPEVARWQQNDGGRSLEDLLSKPTVERFKRLLSVSGMNLADQASALKTHPCSGTD